MGAIEDLIQCQRDRKQLRFIVAMLTTVVVVFLLCSIVVFMLCSIYGSETIAGRCNAYCKRDLHAIGSIEPGGACQCYDNAGAAYGWPLP